MELINIIPLLLIASVPARLAAAEQTSGHFLQPYRALFEVCTFIAARSALALWEGNLMERHSACFHTVDTSLGVEQSLPWHGLPRQAQHCCNDVDAAELGVMLAPGGALPAAVLATHHQSIILQLTAF